LLDKARQYIRSSLARPCANLVNRIGLPSWWTIAVYQGRFSTLGPKAKAVVNAEKRQLAEIERLVKRGDYGSVSEFMREAVDEKLERLREMSLGEQVARYSAAGHSDEDGDLVAAQAFDTRTRRPRAKR
jgi:Arc/MetJ-type ribon-helix-helix transcriptional regulator